MLVRCLKMLLPDKQSTFLWGARQTGKSSFLKTEYPNAFYYDLLDTHEFIRLSKSPFLLKEEILKFSPSQLTNPIIIDEIQKIPELLNEVQWLIDNKGINFILCGSSARRLKNDTVNLLGGRAWIYNFFPLVSFEIPDFNLLQALSHGLLPKHYLCYPKELPYHLEAYVDVYLKEEIKNEGLVRNLAEFARFLDIVGMCQGELINFLNIARNCGIDRSIVQGYFQILIDTMIGYFIYPYAKKIKRDLITAAPKFYLFDVGMGNYLAKRAVVALKGEVAGKSFEHFILMELLAYTKLRKKRAEISYWRTKKGLEVDFIINDAQIAIKVKISEQVHKADLTGLIAFCQEHPNTIPIVISQDKRKRLLEIENGIKISILPWQEFLSELWKGEVL